MNNIFPVELTNIIYTKRATLRLIDLLKSYYIDYHKLCEYLIKHRCVITGSAVISCFDVLCKTCDLDIFVNHKEDEDHKLCYKDFLEIFDIEPSLIKIDKSPICNTISGDDDLIEDRMNANPYYHYKFVYNTPRHIDVTFLYLTPCNIDMTLICDDVKTKLKQYKEFDISNITFDGKSWNIDVDIENFVLNRQITIVNPYDNYFAEIYDFSGETLQTVVNCINNFHLTYEPKTLHQELFDKYVSYYKFPPNDYITAICDMCKLYHDFGREGVTKEYLLENTDNFNNRGAYIDALKRSFGLYRGTYRILKYISKGYQILNINDFLTSQPLV